MYWVQETAAQKDDAECHGDTIYPWGGRQSPVQPVFQKSFGKLRIAHKQPVQVEDGYKKISHCPGWCCPPVSAWEGLPTLVVHDHGQHDGSYGGRHGDQCSSLCCLPVPGQFR